jgi:hypothetical protein
MLHYKINANPVQERARDSIAAQERNTVGTQDKNSSDDKGYDQVNEYPN